jgi:glycosyltransferase involved in cell wall biosynthesis
MQTAGSESAPSVVLLRDGGWPEQPGVCCWRAGVRAAFGAAGATVTEATWQAPPTQVPAAKPAAGAEKAPKQPATPSPRLIWLPPAIREPLVASYRLSRRSAARLRRRATAPRAVARPVPGLDGAQVIVAESMPAARAAIAGGAPAERVWALSLPPQRSVHGGRTPFTALVAELAPRVAGFLADSEIGRDAVERAASASRPRVVVLPPLAADRPCPVCADAAALEPVLDDDSSAGQLALWRALADRSADETLPYSFPAARLRGFTAAWAPAPWLDWTQDAGTTALVGPPDTAPDWSAAAQDRGARAVLDATLPRRASSPRATRTALISGFDLKFVRELGQRLDDRGDLDVTVDEWPTLSQPTGVTLARSGTADVILAEWVRPSAVWLAQRKKPEQFMVARLHRFEIESAYPRQLDIDKVDAVVYIAPQMGPRIRDELGWPKEKLVYIPNFLDIDWFDRPKLPEARFTIGMVGVEWRNKRIDLALDVLARVRREDPRFSLVVRSTMPWDNRYAWPKAEEQEYVGLWLDRVERDPLLRGAVVFDQPGRDMARWYRRVGSILSMSDVEGVHLAAAEGMASGAVPVIRPWPGARESYDERWVHESAADAAAAVLGNADPEVWAERSAAAVAEMRRRSDPAAVVDAWADLLHGEVDRARGYFAAYARL